MKYVYVVAFFLVSISVYSQESSCNCCTQKHSEFDFWVGDWVVTNPSGQQVGTNSIDKLQDNCILRENWISSNGKITGTSHNFYNQKSKQWEQVWIDNVGGNLHLKGNRIGNQMILKSDEELNSQGQPFYHKVTWTLNDDGSVRQYWETITNGTDTVVAFDGLYKKNQ